MDLYLGAATYVTFWGNCIWWFYKRALDIAPKKKKYHRPATFCPLRCCSWLTNIWLRIDKFQYGQNPPHPSSRVFLFFWNWRVSNNQKFYFHNFNLCNVILEGKAFPLPSSTEFWGNWYFSIFIALSLKWREQEDKINVLILIAMVFS